MHFWSTHWFGGQLCCYYRLLGHGTQIFFSMYQMCLNSQHSDIPKRFSDSWKNDIIFTGAPDYRHRSYLQIPCPHLNDACRWSFQGRRVTDTAWSFIGNSFKDHDIDSLMGHLGGEIVSAFSASTNEYWPELSSSVQHDKSLYQHLLFI